MATTPREMGRPARWAYRTMPAPGRCTDGYAIFQHGLSLDALRGDLCERCGPIWNTATGRMIIHSFSKRPTG